MGRFFIWLKSVFFSVLNSAARVVIALVLLFSIILIITLARGDGMPSNMVLALDLREAISDSSNGQSGLLVPQPVTVMDLVLALENARKDSRVKGVVMKLGYGALSTAEGQEIAAKNYYRPIDEKVAARYAKQFPKISLFTIDKVFGGWQKAQKTHFADGGVFDQIYQPGK